ncbi:MAG: dihydroxyacetone kinase subunit DhaL [Spirochaetota bacterium]
MVTKDIIIRWLRRTASVMEEQKDYLTQLDAAIGDADHGINMERGFKKVIEKLNSTEGKDIGVILRETGMALISSVGGASGPLYGTFFIKASTLASGKDTLNDLELFSILREGVNAVMERGRAQAGDKTMVDALLPAIEKLEHAMRESIDFARAMKRAVASAEEGVKGTIPMIAKKGRASYMGSRSIGHQDPGATSAFLLLKALYETVESDAA